MKKLLLLSLNFLLMLSAWSQPKVRTQLTGQVTDAKTGEPLAGASVVVADSRVGTVTDSTGTYTLTNLPIGHTVIEVSYQGYKTQVVHLDVTANGQQNFALASAIIENEGVTVTAVAGATSIRKAPIPIIKMSKSNLLATPSTNIIDALSHQPGVSQLSTGPAISKPIIRGLGYNRLVVINDGVRQEGQQWGDEHGIEIDENSVNRVEIVKGPASLIYGSDALAGVINIISTSPAPNNTIQGSVLSSYQTNNKQRSLYGSVGGNQHGFNWNVWGDYQAAADYKNKYDGRVFNSGFNEHNYGGYVGYNGAWGFSHLIVSNFDQKLGVIEGVRDSSSGNFVKALPGGVEGIPTESDFNSTTPEIPFQHIQHFKIISDNSFRAGEGRFTLNLGWQRNQRQEFGNPDNPQEKSLYFDLRTFNYSTAYHLPEKNGWHTSIGVNGMAQTNANKGVEVLIPEYDLFDAGTYIYTQKTINKATVSGGLRFDNRWLHSRELLEGTETKFGAFKKDFSNVSGSAGVSYAATDNLMLKFNVARGFRAPSIPELASNGAHEGTNRYEYGDPNLISEISMQEDLGIEVNSEHVLFNASVFYNHISHFIFYSKLSGANGDSLVLVDNNYIPAYRFGQQSAHLAGAEFLVDIHPHPLDWLHWENTVSYVQGRFEEAIEGTNNVPFIPATRWISDLRGEFLPKGKTVRNLTVYVEADHTFNQNHPFTAYGTETPTPGYTLLNAGINATMIHHNKTLFSLYLLGSNLTDVAYQSHLSRLKYTDVNMVTGRQGVFNMGRNISIKLNIPLAFTTK